MDITAARGKDAGFGEPGQPYVTQSGTSMATPHVAGAAAVLKQRHPQWSPEQLKAALMGSAQPNPSLGVFAQGAGRLDLAHAITQPVFATPADLSFGEQRWPHGDDQPITTELTYTNTGPDDITLNLAVTATGPAGRPAPAGMFTLSRNPLTVPSGGRATVTADTRVGTEDDAFTGYLTATGGGVQVRSPLAVAREVESYDLTLVHTGRDGTPSNVYSTAVIPADAELALWDIRQFWGGDSTVTLRLPKGRYIIDSMIVGAEDTTMLNQPKVDLNASQQVNLDARLGKPIRVGIPDRSAISVWAEVTTISHQGSSGVKDSVVGASFAGMCTARGSVRRSASPSSPPS
ncbi:hypothetical protein GCM10009827_081990 [Dactylosporangium maewongense]|uniref:Peptidase S8/S53 domain-containing protein n=1 Tax=Dactylosporangium maewongense TaxID=634393 RepID=A0ABN2C0E6_9ACTN